MNNLEQNQTENKQLSLAEIPAIEETTNTILNKAELKKFIEAPLLSACEEFYDKNIQTLASSANKNDIQNGHAYIIIDFDSLSSENKQVALQYGQPENSHYANNTLKIEIPITATTNAEETSQTANEIAHNFKKQPASWIERYSLSELKQRYGIEPENTEFDDPKCFSDWYYDTKTNLFYRSQELYEKANEKIE